MNKYLAEGRAQKLRSKVISKQKRNLQQITAFSMYDISTGLEEMKGI